MSRPISFLYIVFLLVSPIFTPAQEWVARYNGSSNGEDRANAIALDNAGNIYVTGVSGDSMTWPFMFDYATVKYDPSGVEQWVAQYDGSGNGEDEAYAIAVDNMGNIYVTGYSYGVGTSEEDYATVKYNSSGMEQWVARYNGPGDGLDLAMAIVLDSTGNVYITGGSEGSGTNGDIATVKYDPSGIEQWVARYSGPLNSSDGANAIAVDDAGNIYVTGARCTSAGHDYVTVKYDSAGVEQWVSFYDCSGNEDMSLDIALDNTGHVYVTGVSANGSLNSDYATVKYNPSGVEQWVMRYNGTGNGFDYAESIVVDEAGNVYVTGQSYGSGSLNNYDYAMVKYDSAGVEQWVARYDGPINDYDAARAVAVDNAYNVYVTGQSKGSDTSYDYATVKYDSAGVEQWVVRYNGPSDGWDGASAIAVDNANGVYVTGSSAGLGTGRDYATIRYSPIGIEEQEIAVERSNYLGATICRGPLQLPKDKKCRVFDITGRVVESNKIQPGIYFIEVDGAVTQKVVKVR